MPPGAIPCVQAANWARDVGWAATRAGPAAAALRAKRLRQLLALRQSGKLPAELEAVLQGAFVGVAAAAAGALVSAATRLHLKLCRAQADAAQKAWYDWAKLGQRSGGRRAHRWSRAPAGWAPSKVSIAGGGDEDMQVAEPLGAQGRECALVISGGRR